MVGENLKSGVKREKAELTIGRKKKKLDDEDY